MCFQRTIQLRSFVTVCYSLYDLLILLLHIWHSLFERRILLHLIYTNVHHGHKRRLIIFCTKFCKHRPVFTARLYVSAVYAIIVCLCDCLFVCVSVTTGNVSKRLSLGSCKQCHMVDFLLWWKLGLSELQISMTTRFYEKMWAEFPCKTLLQL